MSKKELLDLILSNKKIRYNLEHTLQQYPDIYQDFLTWNFPNNFNFSQKLYHYIHDDVELKLGHCVVCGKICKFRGFVVGYLECCSHKCAGNYEPKKKGLKILVLKNTTLHTL